MKKYFFGIFFAGAAFASEEAAHIHTSACVYIPTHDCFLAAPTHESCGHSFREDASTAVYFPEHDCLLAFITHESCAKSPGKNGKILGYLRTHFGDPDFFDGACIDQNKLSDLINFSQSEGCFTESFSFPKESSFGAIWKAFTLLKTEYFSTLGAFFIRVLGALDEWRYIKGAVLTMILGSFSFSMVVSYLALNNDSQLDWRITAAEDMRKKIIMATRGYYTTNHSPKLQSFWLWLSAYIRTISFKPSFPPSAS